MIISDSTVVMTGTRNYVEEQVVTEELTVWTGNRERPSLPVEPVGDEVEISDKAKHLKAQKSQSAFHRNNINAKLMILKRLVEKLTGEEIKILDMSEVEGSDEEAPCDGEPQQPIEHPAKGWGVEYHYHESYEEHEVATFNAEGVVHTADGEEINFNLQLDLQRDYASEFNLDLRAGDAAQMVDPLSINFDGAAAELSDMKFSFDLNADGTEEEISSLPAGMGFLAFDVNKDGIINDGSELFGPQTGDGFEELATYDSDGNNWIDENDPIYSDLSVWTKDVEGNDILTSIADQNIGAIFLGSINNVFNLKGTSNELMGQISGFGMYLNENGSPGAIQQIDLVV